MAGALDPVPTHLLCCPCPGDPTGWSCAGLVLLPAVSVTSPACPPTRHPLRHSLLGSKHCPADCLWPLGTEAQGQGELGLFQEASPFVPPCALGSMPLSLPALLRSMHLSLRALTALPVVLLPAVSVTVTSPACPPTRHPSGTAYWAQSFVLRTACGPLVLKRKGKVSLDCSRDHDV